MSKRKKSGTETAPLTSIKDTAFHAGIDHTALLAAFENMDYHGECYSFLEKMGISAERFEMAIKKCLLFEKPQESFDNVCFFCGRVCNSEHVSIEHLIPKSALKDIKKNCQEFACFQRHNVVIAHVGCNAFAGNLPLFYKIEWAIFLRKMLSAKEREISFGNIFAETEQLRDDLYIKVYDMISIANNMLNICEAIDEQISKFESISKKNEELRKKRHDENNFVANEEGV